MKKISDTIIKKIFLFFIFLLLRASFCFSTEITTKEKYPNAKLFGFTHLWAKYDYTRDSSHGTEFSVARFRAGFKGDLTEKSNYMILAEAGRLSYDDPITLLDAWVNFKLSDILNIKLGQTWYKFSLDGTEPLPNNPFIFRPEVIDGIWLTMGRNGLYAYDKGIEFSGDYKTKNLTGGYIFSITTGVGLSHSEDNDKKDFTERIWVEPIKGLRIGASGFEGWSKTSIKSNLGKEMYDDLFEYAYGADLSYINEYFRFISEFLQGLYEGYLKREDAETFSLATKKPRGWYAMLGWKVLPFIEIPIRYAWYEKDISINDTGISTITLGLTYYIKGNNKIMFNYLIRDTEQNYGSKPKDLIAFQVQLTF